MVDLLELLPDVSGSMDGVFLQQCIVLAASTLLENNKFQHLPKLYSCSRQVFARRLGYVKTKQC